VGEQLNLLMATVEEEADRRQGELLLRVLNLAEAPEYQGQCLYAMLLTWIREAVVQLKKYIDEAVYYHDGTMESAFESQAMQMSREIDQAQHYVLFDLDEEGPCGKCKDCLGNWNLVGLLSFDSATMIPPNNEYCKELLNSWLDP